MIAREAAAGRLREALRRSRVVALLGPRQCGKTTLARTLLPAESPNYFDLENPVSLALLDAPLTALESLRGLVVLDEVQRRPDLFPVLRVLADRPRARARFLILGSASPALLRQSSESLAGRLEVVDLGGLTLRDVGARALGRLWLRGTFPRAYLARTLRDSAVWRRELMRTVVERDVPQLGAALPAQALLRFWAMLAHVHGNTWNAADPARSLAVSEPTVRRYLDLLTGLLLVRQLPPWHENLSKRQVRAPKVFVRDSGLLHQLLGIRTERELLEHPRLGASWEGFAVEEVITALEPEAAYFWATHAGAELDLLLLREGRRLGVEVKRSDAPVLTASMRIALRDLRLDRLIVVYPGSRSYRLAEGVEVLPLAAFAEEGALALWPGCPPRRR
jgi:hypothetical protein